MDNAKLIQALREVMIATTHPKSSGEHYSFLVAWNALREAGASNLNDTRRAEEHRRNWYTYIEERQKEREAVMERLKKGLKP